MPTVRHKRVPTRRDARVPAWVHDLVERGVTPVSGSEAECDYCAWLFWNQSIAGLPAADSEAGQAILQPIWERERRKRDRAEEARRRVLYKQLGIC